MIEKHLADLQIYCAYLMGRAPSDRDVEEVLSDAVFKMGKAHYQGRNGASWLTWAKRIVYTTFCTWQTNPRRQMIYTDDIGPMTSEYTYNDSLPSNTAEFFNRMTAYLPRKYLAIIFTLEVGFSGAETAEVLGISKELVYSRRYKAKKYLARLSL